MSDLGLANPSQGKKTGVYAADLIPGNYLRTRTGVVRGEELFTRPDLERPWRTISAQKEAMRITLKEKEIEELTRLCSSLRTELGNAKNDMRFLEYSLCEKMKATSDEKDRTIESLNAQINALKKERATLKEDTAHQIRLLQSQHANEVVSVKNDARLAVDRAAQLEKEFREQLEDVRAAGVREVQFVETRFTSQVDALNAELHAEREAAKTARQHYTMQTTANEANLNSVEGDFKERIRASEERVDALRKLHVEELATERKAKEDAIADARRCTEQLALLRVEREDFIQHFKVWNRYILSELDKYYNGLIGDHPELAVEPVDSRLPSLPFIYAPRAVLDDAAAKVHVERVLYRLAQLHRIPGLAGGAASGSVPLSLPPPPPAAALDALIARAYAKQERLRAALREVGEGVADADARLGGLLTRLQFLHDGPAGEGGGVAPPRRNVVFVAAALPHGGALWARDAAAMRAAAGGLRHALRLALAAHGGYACYADEVATLLAFDAAATACRFCGALQEALLGLPWPAFPGPDDAHRGPHLAMAVHAGECFLEDTAGGAHYYGKALSQLVHLTALAQGGQILVSRAVWARCAGRPEEAGSPVVTELGSFQIRSMSRAGVPETETIELVQLLPASLKGRVFKLTSAIEIPAASPLLGLRSFLLSNEVEAITQRREALKESIDLVKAEFHTIEAELRALMDHARTVRTHFPLLSPPEMVDQLNELYVVMEKVAMRTEEVYSDVSQLMLMQEDLEVQSKGLREYLRQQVSQAKTEELRVEIDVINYRAQAALQDAEQKHRSEIESYKQSLAEKDETIRKLYKMIEQHPPTLRSH